MSYINDDIKDKFIAGYGVEKTAEFCKMVSEMYEMLRENLINEGLTDMELYTYQYDYESEWWRNKYNELKKKTE